MRSFKIFAEQLIEKYAARYQNKVRIEVADRDGLIIVDSANIRVGGKSTTAVYAMQSMHPMLISNPEAPDKEMRNYVPVFYQEKVWGAVILHGELNAIRQCGESISDSLSSFLVYEGYRKIEHDSPSRRLVCNLVSPNPDKEYILNSIPAAFYGENNVYAVILIWIERFNMSYFNASLDLGYVSAHEAMRDGMLNIISANAYMTQKDLMAFVDTDHIVIVKSFLKIDDVSRIYLALDKICASLLIELQDAFAYTFHLCYGNIYHELFSIHHSYSDAQEIMELGYSVNPAEYFYTMDKIFFESICDTLHPQIVNKILLPYLDKLERGSKNSGGELLAVSEKYVDNCMSTRHTAEELYMHRNTVDSRMEKFRSLTGLDPDNSFKDAFIIKMLGIYTQAQKAKATSGQTQQK